MKEPTTITRPGRKPNDPEWADLIAKAHRTLPHDGLMNENHCMVEEWLMGKRWSGTSFNSSNTQCAYKDVWLCKIYIGGAQRIIGRGTLYLCARLYDAARLRWADYRTDKARSGGEFNFSKQQAGADTINADFVALFCAIEDYFQRHGIQLLTQAQRDEGSALRRSEQRHTANTATGRIETRLTAIEQSLDRLGSILSILNTLTLQLGYPKIAVQPADSAENLVAAKNNLTPIENVVACTQ